MLDYPEYFEPVLSVLLSWWCHSVHSKFATLLRCVLSVQSSNMSVAICQRPAKSSHPWSLPITADAVYEGMSTTCKNWVPIFNLCIYCEREGSWFLYVPVWASECSTYWCFAPRHLKDSSCGFRNLHSCGLKTSTLFLQLALIPCW